MENQKAPERWFVEVKGGPSFSFSNLQSAFSWATKLNLLGVRTFTEVR
jgi:hypothetical protein